MKAYRFCLQVFLLFAFLSVNANNDWKKQSENPDYLHRSIKQVTDVIVHDIF